ncbi:signal recognition particle-docking protein FtsY [Mesomycoplasma moatsii]|uniref:signal recognition particle-docking protein FtsY n=1 Tax=Mesomycoplasma moatsii TaxID=171287 RepID=UPI0003B48ECF
MGFFKKLKDRLFGKNEDSKDKNSKEIIINKESHNDNNFEFINETKEQNIVEKQEIEKEIETKNIKKENVKKKLSREEKKNLTKEEIKAFKEQTQLLKKQEKLDKKQEKERIKQLTKENKLNKYVAGLSKSGINLTKKITELQAAHNKLDEEFFEELEEILIMSDISVSLVYVIIDEIKKEVKLENVKDKSLIAEIIADKMFAIYANQSAVNTKLNLDHEGLNVLLVVGVNGSGKTTSIAKIAYKLINENKKVLLAAGDTFRAGAVEQLKVWAKRLNIDIVLPDKEGADPASVVYKAFEKTQKEKYDVLIIDTAGRLQNKVNLMNELAKINKIIEKFVPGAPHESLLVLDATTGQNGVIQAQAFKEVTPLSGIVLTKMDGTSNGGIILTIKDKLDLDVKLIGLGEKMDDLQEFDLDSYIYGLMKELIPNEK